MRVNKVVVRDFQGIIHSVRVHSSTFANVDIENNWLRPQSKAALCDYLVSMFDDLGVNRESNTLTMRGYNSFFIEYEPTIPIITSLTDGIKIDDGDEHKIINVSAVNFSSFIIYVI